MDGKVYPAFLTTVGQTFLSALEMSANKADRNVCPTEHTVVDWPRVVRNAGYPSAAVMSFVGSGEGYFLKEREVTP